MLFLVENRILTENRERTYLTKDVAAGATSLTVRAIDANAWSNNDWLILGEIGSSNAEVLQVNGTPTDGTSLTIDNAGSGGTRYAHSADEPVYRIDYNQISFERAATESGAKSTLTTIDLMPSDFETRYDDSANTTGFGFVRFFNSQTAAYSPYSDAIPYDGQDDTSLSKIISRVRTLLEEHDDNYISDEQIIEAINSRQRDIVNDRLWTFNEVERTQSSVANQFDYDIDSDIKTIHTVRFDSRPLVYEGRARWEIYNYDTDATAETPTHVSIWNNVLRFYPRPSTAAVTTTLDGNINDSATTITVADVSSFERTDYYRFIINSEVIYATDVDTTNNQFTGCVRGREGTTATSHTDGDTVTERNICYTGQKYATKLEDQNDKTIVPEPDALAYGAASELAFGKLKDRQRYEVLEAKYTALLEGLRNRFSIKFSSQRPRVKTQEELIQRGIQNPNQYPENVSAP